MVWLSERLGLPGPGMDATLWLAQQRRSERVERVNEEKACSPRKCAEDKGRLSCNYSVTTFIKLHFVAPVFSACWHIRRHSSLLHYLPVNDTDLDYISLHRLSCRLISLTFKLVLCCIYTSHLIFQHIMVL